MKAGRLISVVAALALVATACGSTVPVAQRQRAAGVNGGGGGELNGTTADTTTGGAADAGTGAVSGGSAGRAASGSTGGAGSGVGAAGGGTAGSSGGGGSVANAPGVTDTEISVGIEYQTDDAVNQAAGIQGTAPGDRAGYWRAVVDDINKRGGILGRKVKPVIRVFDSSQGASPADQQQACSFFTEDHKVFAVMARSSPAANYRTCLHNRGVVMIAMGGISGEDDEVYRQLPYYVTAGTFNLNRLARATVDRLWTQGYFKAGSRIGLLTFDQPEFKRAVERAYKPALAAHGLKLKDERYVKQPETDADLPAESAAVSSAVLAFKSDLIDHVLFLETGGDLALFFLNAAEAQGYRPRYGLNSQDAGQVMAANVPAAQLHDAVGIGWLPGVDVPAQNDPPRWPARQRCYDLMKANKLSFPSSYAELLADVACDQGGLLAAAVTAGGSPISKERFVAGLESLGGRFALASTFAGEYGPGIHDGVGAVRDVKFEDGCACFRYTTGDQKV